MYVSDGARTSSESNTVAPSGRDAGRPSIEQMAAMLGLPRESLPPDVARASTRAAPLEAQTTHLADDARVRAEGKPSLLAGLGAIVAILAYAALPASSLSELALALVATLLLGLAIRETWRYRVATSLASPTLPTTLAALVLVALPVVAPAEARSLWLAAAMVLASIPPAVAMAFERYGARVRASRALLRRLPADATIRNGDELLRVATRRVRAGEHVDVGAGERIPVDGVVVASAAARVRHIGHSESAAHEGTAVLAGTTVLEGHVQVLATRAGDDTALARVAMRNDLRQGASPTVRVARFVSAAVVVAALIAGPAVGALVGERSAWISAFIAVAFAASTLPLLLVRHVYAASVREAAGHGAIFRDDAAVDAVASVRSVVLCARGTVLTGQYELVEVIVTGARTDRSVLAVAAAVEEAAGVSAIGLAIVEGARVRRAPTEPVRRPEARPGRGVTAVDASGETVVVGSRRLLLDEGVGISSAEEIALMLENDGRTTVLVAIGGRVEGVLGLNAPHRESARRAAQRLLDGGYELVLLGGAARATLSVIAEALDVPHVRPEVLPEDRAAVVRSLDDVLGSVAVIGKPPLDSAALSAGRASVALAAAGAAAGDATVSLASDDVAVAADILVAARATRLRATRVASVGSVSALVSACVAVWHPGFGPVVATTVTVATYPLLWWLARSHGR